MNAAVPGYVMRDRIQKGLVNSFVFEQKLGVRISLKRLAQPEGIAEVIFYLVTRASFYMKGQVLNVDGGPLIDLEPSNVAELSAK